MLAIVECLGGDAYLNAPGGRALYDAEVLRRCGVEFRFLPPYEGPVRHLLRPLVELEPKLLVSSLDSDQGCLRAKAICS